MAAACRCNGTLRIHFCHTEPQATSFHGLVGQLGEDVEDVLRWYDAAWLAQLVRFALEGILHLNAAQKTPSIRLRKCRYQVPTYPSYTTTKFRASIHTWQGW